VLKDDLKEILQSYNKTCAIVYKQSYSRKINCTEVKQTATKLHSSPDKTNRAWSRSLLQMRLWLRLWAKIRTPGTPTQHPCLKLHWTYSASTYWVEQESIKMYIRVCNTVKPEPGKFAKITRRENLNTVAFQCSRKQKRQIYGVQNNNIDSNAKIKGGQN